MVKKLLVGIFCISTILPAKAQDNGEFFSQTDSFLGTYVVDGKVNYRAILKDQAKLKNLVDLGKQIRISKENVLEYQAFWINAYNLLVIKSVVDNYPLKSPLEKTGFFDTTEHEIGGKKITLNDIEHKLLRGNFPEESRFHFVLVCAGMGCPPIIDNAYLPSTLNAQLEKQTQKALNDPNFIRITRNKVKISQIFEWYKDDFTQGGLSLVEYINRYRTDKLPEKAKASFYEYDWSLNEIK